MQLKEPIRKRISEAWSKEMFDFAFKELVMLKDGWESNQSPAYSGTKSFRIHDVFEFRNWILNIVKYTGVPYPEIEYDIYSHFTNMRPDGIMIAKWHLGDRLIIVEAHRSRPQYMFCGTYDVIWIDEYLRENIIYRKFDTERLSYFERKFGNPFTVHTVNELTNALDRARKMERQWNVQKTLDYFLRGIKGVINE